MPVPSARTLLLASILASCAPSVPPETPANAPPPSAPPLPEPPAPPTPAVRAAAVSPPAPRPAPATELAFSPPPPPTPAPTPAAAAPSTIALVEDPLAGRILASGGNTLKTVLANPERHRFQVLYGIVQNGGLERHGWRADAEYFFPASSMKVPIALATYDRLAVLRNGGKRGMTRDAMIRVHSTSAGEPHVTTVARETWRALIVSDNFAANRLLGIGGHREINETAWSLGLASIRVRTGFATGAEIDPAEVSPRVEFLVPNGPPDELPARRSDLVLPPTDARNLDIGRAHVTDMGKRVEGPLSFADKNAIRLRDLQDTLVRIMRPELLGPGARADTASKEDLAHLRQALGTLPSESGLAGFERNIVADYQLIPFLRGMDRVRARGDLQIFSKVGQAYGFLVANAYIVEKGTGRAFFLAAAIYANPDETMNDDSYGYESTSFPALADVGEAFCRHAFGS